MLYDTIHRVRKSGATVSIAHLHVHLHVSVYFEPCLLHLYFCYKRLIFIGHMSSWLGSLHHPTFAFHPSSNLSQGSAPFTGADSAANSVNKPLFAAILARGEHRCAGQKNIHIRIISLASDKPLSVVLDMGSDSQF